MRKISLANIFLQNPLTYWTYQRIVGGDRARRYFIQKNVKPKQGLKILDIGCGPGNILEYLPEVNYYGVDIDQNYIDAANKKYKDKGVFECSNLDEYAVSEPGSFDLVIAVGVIHHLNDDIAIKLFKIAKNALRPDGHLMTFDGCYVDNQNYIARFLLKKDRGKFVRDRKKYEYLAKTSFSSIKTIIDETYFRVPYTSIIMECCN